jgi:hypothetical protein
MGFVSLFRILLVHWGHIRMEMGPGSPETPVLPLYKGGNWQRYFLHYEEGFRAGLLKIKPK